MFIVSKCGFGNCLVFADFVDQTLVDFLSTKMPIDLIML